MGTRPAATPKTHHAPTLGRLLGEIVFLALRTLLWVGFTAAGMALNMWGAVVLLLLVAPGNLWGYLAVGFGLALAGGIGGAIVGIGQVMALRRWLDGAASLGSFFSTVLASSSALAAGTLAGWWVHTAAGDTVGILSGVVAYGCVFGFLQWPMLDYLARNSFLWVPANAAAALLGALGMLAAFDVSGGRRDTLQFRYVGVVYAVVTGLAFLWMSRETRRAFAAERDSGHASGRPPAPALPSHDTSGRSYNGYEPDVLEIHEHRTYRVH